MLASPGTRRDVRARVGRHTSTGQDWQLGRVPDGDDDLLMGDEDERARIAAEWLAIDEDHRTRPFPSQTPPMQWPSNLTPHTSKNWPRLKSRTSGDSTWMIPTSGSVEPRASWRRSTPTTR